MPAFSQVPGTVAKNGKFPCGHAQLPVCLHVLQHTIPLLVLQNGPPVRLDAPPQLSLLLFSPVLLALSQAASAQNGCSHTAHGHKNAGTSLGGARTIDFRNSCSRMFSWAFFLSMSKVRPLVSICAAEHVSRDRMRLADSAGEPHRGVGGRQCTHESALDHSLAHQRLFVVGAHVLWVGSQQRGAGCGAQSAVVPARAARRVRSAALTLSFSALYPGIFASTVDVLKPFSRSAAHRASSCPRLLVPFARLRGRRQGKGHGVWGDGWGG